MGPGRLIPNNGRYGGRCCDVEGRRCGRRSVRCSQLRRNVVVRAAVEMCLCKQEVQVASTSGSIYLNLMKTGMGKCQGKGQG